MLLKGALGDSFFLQTDFFRLCNFINKINFASLNNNNFHIWNPFISVPASSHFFLVINLGLYLVNAPRPSKKDNARLL